MNELISGIIFGAIVASAIWYVVFKYSNKNKIDLEKVTEKDTELATLREFKKNSEKIENKLTEDLTNERDLVKEQLKTINKVDTHKDAIDQYRTATELKNRRDEEDINSLKNWIEKLAGSSKYQGDIGEKILTRVLNSCEYKEKRDYICQVGDKVVELNDEGFKSVRPDTLIKISNDYFLVVDSKVSLDNFKAYVNEKKDEHLKKEHLKKHLKSINDHIDSLAKKNYANSLRKKVFPSVVMFIAFEAGYLAALEHDPDINEKAYRKNIILAVPGTIMSILRMIDSIKSKDKQIENVREVTKSAALLYDKYSVLKDYLKILVTSYRTHGLNLQKIIDSGWRGKGNLEKQIKNLKEKHGVEITREIKQISSEEEKIPDIDDPEERTKVIN